MPAKSIIAPIQYHFIQKSVGAVPGPMDCFLVLRGTKTLAVRMKQHAENLEFEQAAQKRDELNQLRLQLLQNPGL